jgi:hypothetical protein
MESIRLIGRAAPETWADTASGSESLQLEESSNWNDEFATEA